VLGRYLTDGWIPQTHRNVGFELQPAVLLLLGDDQHGGEEKHQALLVVLLMRFWSRFRAVSLIWWRGSSKGMT